MVFCNRIGRAVAVVGGLLLLAGPAGADLTFQVDIQGEIYSDDGPVVKVKGKDGTTATFPNADVDVEPLLKVKGTMILVLDGMDQFFVGTFKTGSLVP